MVGRNYRTRVQLLHPAYNLSLACDSLLREIVYEIFRARFRVSGLGVRGLGFRKQTNPNLVVLKPSKTKRTCGAQFVDFAHEK